MATSERAARPPLPALAIPGSLYARLRAACPEDWRRYAEHEFVQGLAAGSLPEACFRHYLTQDYLFLIQFARAYGLAVYKADGLMGMRAAARRITALLDNEMGLHIGYCRRWGLDEAAIAATPEASACMAYTRYVLERGMAGDILDLHVALAPCILGYAEIGRALIADPRTRLEGNPYRDWIETYADADYQASAAAEVAEIDRLGAARGGDVRFKSLAETFAAATRLEIGFWEMGLDPPGE
jgi:thiaminase/transcriptional activator TenA